MRTFTLLCIASLAAAAACSSSPGTELVIVPGSGGSGGGGLPTGGGAGPGSSPDAGQPPAGDSGAAAATGLPCNVAMVFSTLCTSCHSDPPSPGALAGLVTYTDLMAKAHEDPTKNEAQLSLARMMNASSPMPPGGLPPAADVATLQSWITAGYPKGTCGGTGDAGGGGTDSGHGGGVDSGAGGGMDSGGGGGNDSGGGGGQDSGGPTGVFANAPPFVSMTAQQTHNAGQDCLGCHTGGGGPAQFTFAGTLYDGNGNPVVGAEVRLLDANGNGTSVYTGPLAFPKVTIRPRSRRQSRLPAQVDLPTES